MKENKIIGGNTMFDKTKKFVKEHKTEILLGGVVVVTTAIGTKLYLDLDKMKTDNKGLMSRISDVTDDLVEVINLHQQNLVRSIKDWEFEIEELENYISNLDESYNFNKFGRIPEKKARINELKGFIDKALEELAYTERKIGPTDLI